MGMFQTSGGGGFKKIGRGSIAGLTNGTPRQILFANYAPQDLFSQFRLLITDLASSGALAAGADINMQFTVAGVAGATAYGKQAPQTFNAFTFADTSIQLFDYAAISTVTDGYAVVDIFNMMKNKKPFGKFFSMNKQTTRSGGEYNFVRDLAAIHDGIQFSVPAADADTQSFNWELFAV